MTPFAYDVLGIICGLLPVPVFLAWRFWPRPATAPVPVPSVPAVPDADAYLPCHTTTCAHLERPHDRTPAGLTCRHCHHTVTEVPRA